MALEILVLSQMQTFVNMIQFSILTIIIHGNAIKILHFNLNCTAIVCNFV